MIEASLALVFGLLIGSFLNVCIHRWPRGRSVVKPRSHCVRCRKMIAWYDNIPVLSYVLLRGKCRNCGRHISIRYPLVELLTGGLFFYFVFTLGPTLLAVKMCIFSAILLALLFSDLEKLLLPDQFTIGGTVIGLIFSFFVPLADHTAQVILWILGLDVAGPWQSFAESAFGAGFPAFILWAAGWLYLKIRKREGLGLGDVKLVAMAGAFLGIQGALLMLIAGSVSGSIIGFAYIKAKGESAATYELPFGTFLCAAGIAIAVASKWLLTASF